MRWWERPLWSLDLETTGADPLTAQIVEWALVRVAPTRHVLEVSGGVVDVAVPDAAAAVHGITSDVTRWGMTPTFALGRILEGLSQVRDCGEPLVVFNAAYDLTVVHSLARLGGDSLRGLRVIDPLVIDRHCDRYRKGRRRLEDVCRQYGVQGAGWHSASGDALAAARLAFAIAEQHHELHDLTLDQLHEAQVAWAAEWADGLQNFKRRNGEPTAVVDGSWPVRGVRERQGGPGARAEVGEVGRL